jgi:hypothetical protein
MHTHFLFLIYNMLDDTTISLHGKSYDLSCNEVVSDWTCEASNNHCEGSLPEWRVLAWVACFVSAVLLVLMPFMPETPTYLLKQGKVEEARKVILLELSHSFVISIILLFIIINFLFFFLFFSTFV